MIVTANQMYGNRLDTSDNHYVRVDDLLFDDRCWQIRYLVVQLESKDGRRVMVDPHLVDAISWEDHGVWLRLPKESIERCEAFVALT